MNAREIPRSGVAGLVGAGIALAIGASAVSSVDPRQTAGYAAWGIFTIIFFVSMVGRLRERRELIATWTNVYVLTAGLWGFFTLAHSILSFGFDSLAYSFVGDLPRVQVLAYEPSFLAFYLVPAFYLSFATSQHYSTAGILAGIIASTSRSGLVGLMVGGVVLLLLESRAVVKKLLICGVATAFAVGLQLQLSGGAYLGFVSKPVATVTQVTRRGLDHPASRDLGRRVACLPRPPSKRCRGGCVWRRRARVGHRARTTGGRDQDHEPVARGTCRARTARIRSSLGDAGDCCLRLVEGPSVRAARHVRNHGDRGIGRNVRVRADALGAVPLDRLDSGDQHRVSYRGRPRSRRTHAAAPMDWTSAHG